MSEPTPASLMPGPRGPTPVSSGWPNGGSSARTSPPPPPHRTDSSISCIVIVDERRTVSVTLDASVWLAAISSGERDHASCAALVESLVEQRVPLLQPGLFVIEVCATIARRTRSRSLAMAAGEATLGSPYLSLFPLDHRLAAEAVDVAATCALRGADAVYVATARHAGATLLTLDAEVRERAAGVVAVQTPNEWLSGTCTA